MRLQLKIKIKHHLRLILCQSYFLMTIGFFLIITNFTYFSCLISSIIAPILFFPAIYLHIEYYFHNRGEEMILRNDNFIYIDKQKIENVMSISEINRIILYINGDLEGRGLGRVYPVANYHYVKIITNSQKEFIITNLMYPNLYIIIKEMKDVKVVIKRSLFCTVFRK